MLNETPVNTGIDWQPIWKRFNALSSVWEETDDPWHKTSSNAQLYQFSDQHIVSNTVTGFREVQEAKSEVFIRWI